MFELIISTTIKKLLCIIVELSRVGYKRLISETVGTWRNPCEDIV